MLRTTAALRKAARTQIARYRCRLCWLVGRRWCRRRRCKGEVEAKIRVGSQSERLRASNQALARRSWRPRSASEASCNGQDRKIRHWQGKLEAKKRVGSQLERQRTPNQALARGNWRPRSASKASRKGQECQIRHWQWGVGGREVRRKPVGRANSARSGTGKGEFDAKMRLGSQSERQIRH